MPPTLRCRSCDRPTTYRTGNPDDGWYQLTVADTGARNGKYRYLGLFCSITCLSNHLPEMARVEADIKARAGR